MRTSTRTGEYPGMNRIKIRIVACFLCFLFLNACGNGQDIADGNSYVYRDDTEQESRDVHNRESETVQTGAESQEESQTPYQNRCPAIEDVDWEAYRKVLSVEEYAALRGFFPVLKEETPFIWTVDAYSNGDEVEKHTVTLDEFFYILNNELIWDDDSDESWLDSIAFCDLDRDGGMELILSLASIDGHYLILKEENGQYYGTDKVYRGFEALQTNGVYVSSDGAEDNYFLQMCFEDGAFREIFLGRVYYGAYYMGDVETADVEVFQKWLEGILPEDVAYYKPETKADNPPVEYMSVSIHNEEEYRAFVRQLEECSGCQRLYLDLDGSETAVYLDDLMACPGLTWLVIERGGRIMARDIESFDTGFLDVLVLRRISAVEEEVLRHVPVLDTMHIELDYRYEGTVPTEELLDNTVCQNIILVWDSQESPGLLTEGERCDSISREWEDISVMLKKGKLRGIRRLNDGEYSYTSFDFYRPDSVWDLCGALISVKDRESGGDKYFDLLEIPEDRLSDADMRCERRIYRQEDLNFDGFKDIVFTGSGDVRERYGNCTVFLWDEQEQKYVFCESAPRDFLWPQQERKRIISAAILESGEEEYHIYEYDGTAFTDRKLVVSFAREEDIEHVSWRYFEEGELRGTLEMIFDESNGSGHISYQGNGITKEEELNQEKVYYREIGQKYFPEFDFYWYG